MKDLYYVYTEEELIDKLGEDFIIAHNVEHDNVFLTYDKYQGKILFLELWSMNEDYFDPNPNESGLIYTWMAMKL